MATGPTVSNASPLIALAQIGQLGLLEHLFGSIVVPPAVVAEVAPTLPTLPGWVEVRPPTQPLARRVLEAALGPGESEALCVAMEAGAGRLILDERAARRLALAMRVPVVGTLGILSAARARGLVPRLRPLLEALAAHDFRLSPALMELALRDAGEA